MQQITRYKDYGERFQEIKKSIMQVEGDFAAVNKKYKQLKAKGKKPRFDPDSFFFRLKTMCLLIVNMYEVNDFEAAMYADKYTLPRIKIFMEYLTNHFSEKFIRQFCEAKTELSTIEVNGKKVEYSQFNYIYAILYWQQMRIAARYMMHWNIIYLEKTKALKSYPEREEVLESFIHFATQGLLNRHGLSLPDEKIRPRLIVFATMPSSGKSFAINTLNEMAVMLGALLLNKGGVLRVGNEQGNIARQSGQTMGLLKNPLLIDIYPEIAELIRPNGKIDLFGKESEEEWYIRDVGEEPKSCIFKTRDSAINSVRCYEFACMDDPTRGNVESANVKIQQQICDLFWGDFQDRFENQDDMFIILCSTIFSHVDVMSQTIKKIREKGTHKSERWRNTEISDDGNSVIIVNDCYAEEPTTGEMKSAFPKFISTAKLKQKEENLDPYLFQCVWRQSPLPPEGLLFSYPLLQTYNRDTLPHDELGIPTLSLVSQGYVDPTRKNPHDYFSFPICRQDMKSGLFYLIDVIFVRKSAKDMYDELVGAIVSNNMSELQIECNTSDDLDTVLNDRLKARSYHSCTISTLYQTKNKAMRIAQNAGIVKKNFVFPESGMYPESTYMGKFMQMFTSYSSGQVKGFDDAPDSMCGFAEKFVIGTFGDNTVEIGKKFW